MADYMSTLTAAQRANIDLIIARMKVKGITNQFTQAAILAVASKESAFLPHSESSYAHTDNARIRSIFGKRLAQYDEAHLTALKADYNAFFDAVYGLAQYGQTATEGHLYVGRGFNQVTFKGNYRMVGEGVGVDLIAHPERLNEPLIASDALIYFFTHNFDSAQGKAYLWAHNERDINDFKSTTEALNAIFQANRGWSKTGEDTTGGYDKALSRVAGFYDLIVGKHNA
jgi:predicted chitinase